MNQNQTDFLSRVIPAAQASQAATGVPASVTIAQAIFESSNQNGWGQSTLAREANNYFGIKAIDHANPDDYIELPTAEYINGNRVMIEADFAKYETVADSFIAHARLLSTAPRYAPAMAVKSDPVAFAQEIQKCGYSTSPTYAASLLGAIGLYDLKQYDTPLKAA